MSSPEFEAISLGGDAHGGGPGNTGASVFTATKAKAFTKLECFNAVDVNATVLWFNIWALVAIIFAVISIILAHTLFSTTFTLPKVTLADGTVVNIGLIKTFTPAGSGAAWFEVLEGVILVVCFVYSVVLFVGFTAYLMMHLLRYKKRHGDTKDAISNEQMWTLCLVFMLMIYMNPYDPIIRIIKAVNPKYQSPKRAWFVAFAAIRIISFAFASQIYVWFNVRSYAMLDSKVQWKNFGSYAIKIVLVLLCVVYKLIFAFVLDIYFSEVPFMSAAGCLRLYISAQVKPRTGIASVAILTITEAVICIAMARDIMKTNRLHNKSDYMLHRTKIVGYRFFLHQHAIFYGTFVIIYALILLGFPLGPQKLSLWLGTRRYKDGVATAVIRTESQNSIFDTLYAPVGLYLIILGYATIEALSKLPADTIVNPFAGRYTLIGGFAADKRNWDADDPASEPGSARSSRSPRSSRGTSISEPISYRRNEPEVTDVNKNVETVASNPNCFTMATHIKLFNLSWYIYYYGTAKQKKLDLNLADHNLNIVTCVNNEETDTRVLILEANDRICVAFKGTSSKKNVSTDIRVTTKALRDVLPTELDEDRVEDADNGADDDANAAIKAALEETRTLCATGRYRRARIHAGFAQAYTSISTELLGTLRTLLEKKARPVLLCGHSLGGALATIASTDLVLQPWWGRLRKAQSTLVSTFGSPRVGNRSFRWVYVQLRVTNWRLVAGGDLISRLPKLGYKHVGRRVAISAEGSLFVDPDALETRLWHRPAASIVHHRKATYLLALRAWCDKHHGKAAHGFWSFPVSKADSKRYEELFQKKDSGGGPASSNIASVTTISLEEKRKLNKARLQVWSDAIDRMEPRKEPGTSGIAPEKETPLERWTRFTKLVVGDLRAHSRMLADETSRLDEALEYGAELTFDDDEDIYSM